MKALTLSALLFSSTAFAEEKKQEPQVPYTYWASKPIQCSSMEDLVEMTKKYGEVPTIVMDGETAFPNGMKTASRFVISMNPETETWTLIEFVSDSQACVLGSGQGNIALGRPTNKTAT
jgi:hypothetical protein